MPSKLHAVMFFKRPRQRDEVVGIHLHPVGMALVADQLSAMPGNLAVHGARPIPLVVLAMTIMGRRSLGSQSSIVLSTRDDLRVVGAVFQREDIPSVGSPLIDEIVAAELARDDAAQQHIVDAGVVVRKG